MSTPVLPDFQIDEEALKESLTEILNENLGDYIRGLKKPEPKAEPPPEYPLDKPTTMALDVEDTLRMENYIMRKQIEGLTRQLEEARREKAERDIGDQHEGLQNFLAEKHGVDTSKFKLGLDPTAYTLTVIPLELAANNQGN